NGLDDSPQLQIDIDQRKAQALGVDIDDINDTLQTAWGSSYVNDFMDRGRVKKVYVQAAAPYRMLPDDINLWYVRNKDGGIGFAPIFPDICYHLTHYKPAAADIPVASDNPAHYADAIRYNARTPLQGSLLPLTRLVWA